MTTLPEHPFPRLQRLPATFPVEGAICLELHEGIPVLRACASVQKRITTLMRKQQEAKLSAEETEELERYEEIDDYLSFLYRLVRNLLQGQQT